MFNIASIFRAVSTDKRSEALDKPACQVSSSNQLRVNGVVY